MRRMSSTATVQQNIAQGSKGIRARPTTPARYFFTVAAITMLTTMVAGFHPYYLRGEGMAGRRISPQLATLVFVHGAAMTAWLMLFLVQSLLVPARRLRLHMKLGWGGVAVALVAAGSGFMLAVESVRPVPAIPFWGMAYRQFLLVMLIEVGLFTLFVSFLGGATDRWLTAGYAVMVVVYIAACQFAISDTWSVWAKAVLNE
jgi:hypothetical protein